MTVLSQVPKTKLTASKTCLAGGQEMLPSNNLLRMINQQLQLWFLLYSRCSKSKVGKLSHCLFRASRRPETAELSFLTALSKKSVIANTGCLLDTPGRGKALRSCLSDWRVGMSVTQYTGGRTIPTQQGLGFLGSRTQPESKPVRKPSPPWSLLPFFHVLL